MIKKTKLDKIYEPLVQYIKKAEKINYSPSLNIEEIITLIDKIKFYYEINMPEKILNNNKPSLTGKDNLKVENKYEMPFSEFLDRLPLNEKRFLLCNFRSNNFYIESIINKETKEIVNTTFISLSLQLNNKQLIIFFDEYGRLNELSTFDLKFYFKDIYVGMNITELREILKNEKSVDSSELDDLFNTLSIDQSIRNLTLKIAGTKMVEDEKDYFFGYSRAIQFSQDVNETLNYTINNLNQTTEIVQNTKNRH